jgi:hypothetical protein
VSVVTEDRRTIVRQVLWVTDGEEAGYTQQPGSFVEALIHAIFKADPQNRRILARAYPTHVAVVVEYKEMEGGYDRLVKEARG